MKQKKFNKKLSLNKKTIANLNNGEKGNVLGGDDTKTCFIMTFCLVPITIAPCDPCGPPPTRTCGDTCTEPSACSAGGACC